MANLVPLHIDKDTGKIVASDKGAGQVPIGGAFGYVHHQTTTANTWTITHNGHTNNVICQIYDNNYDLILSDNLHIVDINTIEIAFGAPQDGYAHIIMFKTLP